MTTEAPAAKARTARSGDAEEPGNTEHDRVRAAAAADAAPALLETLAADASVLVRSAVALNPVSPPRANRRLARDPDQRVRKVLVRKLATLLPSLTQAEHRLLAEDAWSNLATLARDEAEQIRMQVADFVKQLPNAPRDIVLALAADACRTVSDPVLRLSPVLTTQDLLALLAAPPAPHVPRSIAARPNLDPMLCDRIAGGEDAAAIAALLRNRSAAIREATLDGLVARAQPHTAWHAPLCAHKALTGPSARLLSGFVAERLLRALAARTDLDPALRAELSQRLQPVRGAPRRGTAAAEPWHGEPELIAAIRTGDSRNVAVLLASAAGLTLQAVQHAAMLRNAKAAVSLLWKGGFSMRPAAAVQAMLFDLPPEAMLRAGPGGGFPLTETEMSWQLSQMSHAAGG